MNPPAFQLYAADFYMDTASWSPDAVGFYVRLLFYEWVNGSIPDDIEKLARIGGCMGESRKWKSNTTRMWREVCHKFVTVQDGNLVNVRLEKTREDQQEYKRKLSESGRLGGLKTQENKHITPSDASSKPSSKPSSKNEALQSSSSTSIKTINSNIVFEDDKFNNIPDKLIEKWKIVAPGIKIQDEIRKAELWVISNPEKKRSKWATFLSNWMVRAQDNFIKYGGNGSGPKLQTYADKGSFRTPRQLEADKEAENINRAYYQGKAAKSSAPGETKDSSG